LGEIVSAMEAENWSALWSQSHPEAQEEVLLLHRSLHEGLAVVEDLYETANQPIARAALGRDLVGDIPLGAEDIGPRMLAQLFAADAIRLDDKGRDGLTATRATINGDRAVVHTTAGEVFTFGRSDGAWRSRLLIDILEGSRPIATLRESAKAVQTAKKVRHEAWATSRDPREPQGAYNLVRFAMERTPFDATVAYAVLDTEARGVLLEALKTARAAQARIMKRTSKRQRQAAYERHGISLHVKADSDRALYEAWAASKTFVPPVADATRPVRVDPGESEESAVVVTQSKQQIAMSRNAEGMWRLSGVAQPIRRVLLEPAKTALSKLGGGNRD
jgi:hypothetical protein